MLEKRKLGLGELGSVCLNSKPATSHVMWCAELNYSFLSNCSWRNLQCFHSQFSVLVSPLCSCIYGPARNGVIPAWVEITVLSLMSYGAFSKLLHFPKLLFLSDDVGILTSPSISEAL